MEHGAGKSPQLKVLCMGRGGSLNSYSRRVRVALDSWISDWIWNVGVHTASKSLQKKGEVAQAFNPGKQMLQMPGDLPRHEAEGPFCVRISAQGRWSESGCQSMCAAVPNT